MSPMSRTNNRDFHDDDLDGIVRLYDGIGHRRSRPVYAFSEVIASCREDHAVVACNCSRNGSSRRWRALTSLIGSG